MNKPRPDKHLDYSLALLAIGIALLLAAQTIILAIIALAAVYAVAPNLAVGWLGLALAGIMDLGWLGFLWMVTTVIWQGKDE